MKKLIYKNETYYISDDTSDSKGKTRMLKYKVSPENMPHKHFSKYIVVYGRQSCPYCIKTIEILTKYPKSLFIDIDTEPIKLFGKTNLLDILKTDINGHTTVPIVFDKGVFIGGASEAEKHFE